MIKTTTSSARRLGTKLVNRPPRRRTVDARGSWTPPSAMNFATLSSQRPNLNGNQSDLTRASKGHDPSPKRWQRGRDLRSIHHQSDAANTKGKGATHSSTGKEEQEVFTWSKSPSSYTNTLPANPASHKNLGNGSLQRAAGHNSASESLPTTKGRTASRPSLKPLNTVRGRQQQLLDLEVQQKRIAIDSYVATGDPAHFLPFLGPFSNAKEGNDKTEHGEWQWDEETERHFKESEKAPGTRIWAPVEESFI